MSIDLHIHSTASDGSQTPEEIIETAVSKGLTAVSIADHDTVGGQAAAIAAAAGRITYLPAVEISTHIGHSEIHIIGYLIDLANEPLLQMLEHIRQQRVQRIHTTVARLQETGLQVTFDDVMETWHGERTKGKPEEAALGRPHVANTLVRLGIVQNPVAAFDLYLRRGRPAYVDRYRLEPVEAIRLIRTAGGLPVLSHPALAKEDGVIPQLVLQGIGGLEAYHTAHTPADTKRYLRMAQKLNVLVTGGTDSHGPTGSYPIEVGSLDIPDECAQGILRWKAQQ